AFPCGIDEDGRLRGVPVPHVVGRELVIPSERAGLALEREHGVRVEVVALAVVAVVLLARIPRRPVDEIEHRVIAAREPGGRAAVLDVLAAPGLGARLAAPGDAPEAPALASRLLVEGRDEAVRAVLPARDTRDHEIAGHERRGRSAVVLAQ